MAAMFNRVGEASVDRLELEDDAARCGNNHQHINYPQ
jgi:hypothetical protein